MLCAAYCLLQRKLHPRCLLSSDELYIEDKSCIWGNYTGITTPTIAIVWRTRQSGSFSNSHFDGMSHRGWGGGGDVAWQPTMFLVVSLPYTASTVSKEGGRPLF